MLYTAERTMMEWGLCKQVRAGAAGTLNSIPLRHLHSHSSSLMHFSTEMERTKLNICHSVQMLEYRLGGGGVNSCVRGVEECFITTPMRTKFLCLSLFSDIESLEYRIGMKSSDVDIEIK